MAQTDPNMRIYNENMRQFEQQQTNMRLQWEQDAMRHRVDLMEQQRQYDREQANMHVDPYPRAELYPR